MAVPTSDNPHLSEAKATAPPTRAGDPDSTFALTKSGEGVESEVAAKVRQLVQAATSANTRRAYRSDLAHFLANGGRLPATADEVAVYLALFAGKLAVSTLMRRAAAIGRVHSCKNLANPCRAELIRLTLRGIRRTYGRPQRQARALTTGQIHSIVAPLGESLRDHRDRALILIGFYGAFRRSELIALDCKSIEWSGQGILTTIRKSKTDQERRGREIAISRSTGTMCPVTALQCWIEASGIVEGPLFRPIDRAGTIAPGALSGEAVSIILKRRLKQNGCDPEKYSGHSLRAGFVTEAVKAGMPTWKIRRQTGHASDAMLDRYIRQVTAFSDLWRI